MQTLNTTKTLLYLYFLINLLLHSVSRAHLIIDINVHNIQMHDNTTHKGPSNR